MSLTNEEYTQHMDMLVSLCRLIDLLPVDELLDSLAMAETLSPVIDPTKYINGGADRMRDQRWLLEAASGLKAAMNRIATARGLRESTDAAPAT